jgi:hypothetical protein
MGHHIAIELNKEVVDGVLNLDESEIEDLIELHHIVVRPVRSKLDLMCIQHWSNEIGGGFGIISPSEFLAEIYTNELNDYALEKGANVARIYHNSCLGDNRIRANSIGHIFEPNPSQLKLPQQVLTIVKKYVQVLAIVPGEKVTLRNRLGAQ